MYLALSAAMTMSFGRNLCRSVGDKRALILKPARLPLTADGNAVQEYNLMRLHDNNCRIEQLLVFIRPNIATSRNISTSLLYTKQNAPGIKVFVHP